MIDPKVSIIIPHRDQPDQLRECLDRLMELGYGNQEILVVDNDSTFLPENLKEYPVKILRSGTFPSPYIARNLGISHASTDIIVLLDVNAIVVPGWLENALKLLREDTILGGIASRPDPATLDTFQRFDYLHSVIDPLSSATLRALPATNLFFYKKVWDAVGPFREVRSLGDMDWTIRARALGFKLITDGSIRFHYPFKTGKAFTAKYRRLGAGHAEHDSHPYPVWYVIKNFLPPSPGFVKNMLTRNRKERMNLSWTQIFLLCYWVKANYGIGYIRHRQKSR